MQGEKRSRQRPLGSVTRLVQSVEEVPAWEPAGISSSTNEQVPLRLLVQGTRIKSVVRGRSSSVNILVMCETAIERHAGCQPMSDQLLE